MNSFRQYAHVLPRPALAGRGLFISELFRAINTPEPKHSPLNYLNYEVGGVNPASTASRKDLTAVTSFYRHHH